MLKNKHQIFHSVRCAATNFSECVMTPPRIQFEISYFTFKSCEFLNIMWWHLLSLYSQVWLFYNYFQYFNFFSLQENTEETEEWNPEDHQVTLYIHLYYYYYLFHFLGVQWFYQNIWNSDYCIYMFCDKKCYFVIVYIYWKNKHFSNLQIF